MAKKNSKQAAEELKNAPAAKTNTKESKQAKDTKKKANQKPKKSGLVKKSKETASELKKVTWPKFGDVVKQTSVVIAFVLMFGVFLYGLNTLLAWLVGLLVG